MSAATEQLGDAANLPPVGDPGLEARARVLGWKDKHEFAGGAPESWVDAATFIEQNAEHAALLRQQVARLERNNAKIVRDFEETKSTLVTVTDMMRRADERAMTRARKEFEAEKRLAIEAGDAGRVAAADAELEALKPPVQPPAPKPAAPTSAVPTQAAPEVIAFANRNASWWNLDQDAMDAADAIHRGLKASNPEYSLANNLAETERLLAQNPQFAHYFQNRRRTQPGQVTPSGEPPAPAKRGNGRAFTDMPQESQKQFHRFVKTLEGKGKPLTQEEWAANYWSQFEEV